MKLRKISGEDNSSDLGTKYLERLTFEKHRRAAGLRSRGGDAGRGQVNAIEEFPNNGIEMTVTGMARCFAGILAIMQVKSVRAERLESHDFEGSFLVAAYVTVVAMAFVWGYWFGQAEAKNSAAARPEARGVHASTNTDGNDVLVGLEDLTVLALRGNLRRLFCSPSGTKRELIIRLQDAMSASRVVVSSR